MLQRLRDFREDKDISQQKMAELLNVAQTTYSDYERGKINIPLDTQKTCTFLRYQYRLSFRTNRRSKTLSKEKINLLF